MSRQRFARQLPRLLSCLAAGAMLVLCSCRAQTQPATERELRVGTTPGALPAVREMLASLDTPGGVTLAPGAPSPLLAALRRGTLDVVFLPGPLPRHGGLRCSLAGWQSLAVVASLLADRQAVGLAELRSPRLRLTCCRDSLPSLAELLGCEVDSRSLAVESLDSAAQVRRAVAADPSALGILPLSAVRADVRALRVDGVHPDSRAIASGAYPLARPLFLLTARPLALPGLATPLPATVALAAVGDVMLARGVEEVMLAHGWLYPFAKTAEFLRSADITFANLECPLATGGRQINVFRANPKAVAGLLCGGIDVVSLANNHILDYDAEALRETIHVLRDSGIRYAGAGSNLREARTPALLAAGGLRIAFLAYTETWFTFSRTGRPWQATPALPGVAPARPEYVVEDIAAARQAADVVIVSFHWGKEYSPVPTDTQRRLGRLAIDAGADLVIGHHPHVLQGVEFYRDGVIAYSLGNFIFDGETPETKHSVILWANLSADGVAAVDFIPAFLPDSQPEILEGARREAARERILALSRELIRPGK